MFAQRTTVCYAGGASVIPLWPIAVDGSVERGLESDPLRSRLTQLTL